jgi:hypothetical protein
MRASLISWQRHYGWTSGPRHPLSVELGGVFFGPFRGLSSERSQTEQRAMSRWQGKDSNQEIQSTWNVVRLAIGVLVGCCVFRDQFDSVLPKPTSKHVNQSVDVGIQESGIDKKSSSSMTRNNDLFVILRVEITLNRSTRYFVQV